MCDGFGNTRIPHCVQIGVRAVECHINIVAADIKRFVVQRLVNVADEVDEKFEGVFYFRGCEGLLFDAAGLGLYVRSQ